MPHQGTKAEQAIHDIDFHEPRFDRNTLRLHKFAKTERPSLRRKSDIGLGRIFDAVLLSNRNR